MEVGKVIVRQREVTTYSVRVNGPVATVTLTIDEGDMVKIMGEFQAEAPLPRFRFAEFNSAYLHLVYAAIGAVLEAMGEGQDE